MCNQRQLVSPIAKFDRTLSLRSSSVVGELFMGICCTKSWLPQPAVFRLDRNRRAVQGASLLGLSLCTVKSSPFRANRYAHRSEQLPA